MNDIIFSLKSNLNNTTPKRFFLQLLLTILTILTYYTYYNFESMF